MNLREYIERHAPGQTQAEIARRFGISRSYLAEILGGTKKPGREAISKIEAGTSGLVPASVWFARETERNTKAPAQ